MSGLRLTRAARPLLAGARATAPISRAFPAAQRAFSLTSVRSRSDVVRETEIPVSVYSPDSKGAAGSTSDHFSIPVNRDDAQPKPFPPPEDTEVIPLSKSVWRQMPPTMQKMSIMDKVVIITG